MKKLLKKNRSTAYQTGKPQQQQERQHHGRPSQPDGAVHEVNIGGLTGADLRPPVQFA